MAGTGPGHLDSALATICIDQVHLNFSSAAGCQDEKKEISLTKQSVSKKSPCECFSIITFDPTSPLWETQRADSKSSADADPSPASWLLLQALLQRDVRAHMEVRHKEAQVENPTKVSTKYCTCLFNLSTANQFQTSVIFCCKYGQNKNTFCRNPVWCYFKVSHVLSSSATWSCDVCPQKYPDRLQTHDPQC